MPDGDAADAELLHQRQLTGDALREPAAGAASGRRLPDIYRVKTMIWRNCLSLAA